MAFTNGMTVEDMKVATARTKNMGMANTHIQTELSISATGRAANNMAKE